MAAVKKLHCTPPPRVTSLEDNMKAKSNASSCTDPQGGDDRTKRRKEKKLMKKKLRQQMKMKLVASIQSQSNRVDTTPTIFDSLPTLRGHPQETIVNVKPLIVLDLNGILCHRVRQRIPASNTNTIFRPSVGNIANTEIIPRSDLHEFLTLLSNHFCLAVWTSATRKTAIFLVKLLFPDEMRERLVFIWHRNFCHLVKKSDLDTISTENEGLDVESTGVCSKRGRKAKKRRRNNSRINKLCMVAGDDGGGDQQTQAEPSNNTATSNDELLAIKSLEKVWSAYPLWDASNTILLDDSPEKCPRQYRRNALHPPPILGTVTCVEQNDKKKGQCGEGGDATSNSEGGSSNEDSYSAVDDDEANQRTQRNFFRLLAEHWAQPATSQTDLMAFLEEHAQSHNMNC